MAIEPGTRCTFIPSSAGMIAYAGTCTVLYLLGADWFGADAEVYVVRTDDGRTVDAFVEELTPVRPRG